MQKEIEVKREPPIFGVCFQGSGYYKHLQMNK